MNWVRNNPSLAAGIFLPLLLMAIFAAATIIPQMLVEPPKNDLLFYVDSYRRTVDVDVRLNVIDGKLRAEYRKKKEQYSNLNVELYYYSAAADSTREISVLPPSGSATDEWQEFPIAETAALTLTTSTVAPDGYRINDKNYRGGHVFGLFGGGYYSRGFGISKDGRSVIIKASPDSYSGNTHFLGWAVK